MGSTQAQLVKPKPQMEQDGRDVFKFKPYKLSLDLNSSSIISRHVNQIVGGSRSPKPRSGHRIVCDDTNVYSFGGYNPLLSRADEADLAKDIVWSESKPLFKELWKYNIPKKSWIRLDVECIPDILASNAVILSGQVLMVYGGTGVPFGANCSNDLYICNLGSNSNLPKFKLFPAEGNCPLPQYGQAIVLINEFLYTIGGTTGFQYTCDIHKLNLRSGVWEAVYTCKGTDNEPAGRYRHEVAFDGQRIFVLGGGTAEEVFDLQEIFAFNLSSLTWEKITTRPDNKTREAYPAPRRCHSCVQHDGYVYIICGFAGRLMLRDVWRLDLITFEWTKFPNFSFDKGLYFHSSCVTSSGKLITFGGITESNSTKRSSSVHSAWLGIPKLKEICWEALLFYHPLIDSYTKDVLILSGLPVEFIQRLSI